MKLLVFTTIAFVVANLDVRAEMSIGHYRKMMASGDGTRISATKIYIMGLGEGMVNSDAFIVAGGHAGFFCPPLKLALEMQNFLDILDGEIKKWSGVYSKPVLDEKDVSALLLRGLVDTFPCESPNH